MLKKLRLRENHVEGTRQTTSVTSEKGGHGETKTLFLVPHVSQKRGWRLFIKNTGLC